MTTENLNAWHQLVASGSPDGLEDLLHEDAVFHSPILFKPQPGKALTSMYLQAAFQVLVENDFHYVRELVDGHDAVLEFVANVDGIEVNGVDMIRWNEEGQIIDFKVMLRPMKAIELVRQKMAAMLESMS